MSGLRDLQQAMQRSVLRQDVASALSIIANTQGASGSDRLGVYIHAYSARLADVLRNDFIGLLAMVGEGAFNPLARAYIEARPSHEFNVRWFGAGLAEFLSTAPPWSATPAIGEMARLDWAIGLCFDAPQEPRLRAATLEALPPDRWPDLRLRLRRCVQRLDFDWNVGDIRRAADRGDRVPELARLPARRGWVVSRVSVKTFHRELPEDEAAALDAIAEGKSFADVCETLSQRLDADAVATRAIALLRGWIDAGWIADLSG